MTAINEAYRVLGQDARRAAYDLSLGATGPFVATSPVGSSAAWPPNATPTRPAPGPPARMPWKLMGGIAAIGIAVVLIGAALNEPAAERPPDGVVGPGSCVAIESNNDAREVNCRGDGDLVVDVVVPFGSVCPNGTEPHRDRQGLGIACVIPVTGP